MIPQTIHYCWFGRNPKPKLAQKCIKSWKKHCKGYQIIEWNEDNFDILSCPLYVRQAYSEKKWAFVTDYVRLQVVYEYGGVYFDTDVELIKNIDHLLTYHAWFGFEDGVFIATGLGFGAEQGCSLLYEMMQDYQYTPFILPDGEYDKTPCPRRNTKTILKYGLKQDDSFQVLDCNILILPTSFLCPLSYNTGIKNLTKNTISIHHFDGSWLSASQKQAHKKMWKDIQKANRKHYILTTPNRILMKLLGAENYEKLKQSIKHQ